MSMIETLKNISCRDSDGNSVIEGFEFITTDECANDYYKERLPTIPEGTKLMADFAGDFGMYAIAEIGGVLHKVKLEVHELHKVDFGPFDARKS